VLLQASPTTSTATSRSSHRWPTAELDTPERRGQTKDGDDGHRVAWVPGRRRPTAELPPGQYLVEDFPVLSAGPTPSIDLEDWEFTVTSETAEQRRWDWAAFQALPSVT
jgi:hypothetical protein